VYAYTLIQSFKVMVTIAMHAIAKDAVTMIDMPV
jgi:hypothetical protein